MAESFGLLHPLRQHGTFQEVCPWSVATPGQNIIYRHVDGFQSNAVATLNPTTVLTVRFGQNRFPDFEPNISNGFQLTTLGFPAAVNALTPQYPDFPAISLSNDYTSFGGGTASWTVYHSQSVNAEVAKFMGKHSVKFGHGVSSDRRRSRETSDRTEQFRLQPVLHLGECRRKP